MNKEIPTIIHSHYTTWHDGSVAMVLPNGQIVALAAERVGDRFKHSWDSELAYTHLKHQYPELSHAFGGSNDHFQSQKDGLENNNHHLYHAAGTFFASPFTKTAVLVVDGQGPDFDKRASTSLWYGQNQSLTLLESPHLADGNFAPESIGHFYTAIGALCGMQELHEEGKTMGLAPYGEPSPYMDFFSEFVHTNSDGTYDLDPKFIYAMLGNTLGLSQFYWQAQPPEIQKIWQKFLDLRGKNIRQKGQEITQDDMNIAFAGQVILEEIMMGLATRIKQLTNSDYLCLSGGVALNSVTNGKILQSGLFKDVYIMPAAGDDGQAIGKLLLDIKSKDLPVNTQISTAYLGPQYSQEATLSAISRSGDKIKATNMPEDDLSAEIASRIAKGEVIGWYQGKSEIGPRALGNRSILADPRNPDMRDHINHKVKFREWYRPLAPVIIEELTHEYFDAKHPSPFMLLVANVLPEQRVVIPAVTHIDGSARLQTVAHKQNPQYYNLIAEFNRQTGIPVLLNTSFNGKGEPIVETPQDAINSFLKMKLDALVLGNYLITKT